MKLATAELVCRVEHCAVRGNPAWGNAGLSCCLGPRFYESHMLGSSPAVRLVVDFPYDKCTPICL